MNNIVIMGGLMWPNDLMGGLLDHGMFHPGNGRVHVLKTLPRWSKYEESMNSGWWFQTRFFFHFIYGMSSFPLTNSYFWLLQHQPE